MEVSYDVFIRSWMRRIGTSIGRWFNRSPETHQLVSAQKRLKNRAAFPTDALSLGADDGHKPGSRHAI